MSKKAKSKSRKATKSEPPETLVPRLTIQALFGVPEFLDHLVLKGGNAIALIHGGLKRASTDIDFSLDGDLDRHNLAPITAKISESLTTLFRQQSFHVFDLSLTAVPNPLSDDLRAFWGGYNLEFKIVTLETAAKLKFDPKEMRGRSVRLWGHGTVHVDISSHEFCSEKQPSKIGSATIYVYTRELIVAEKLRALCQQNDGYSEVIKRSRIGSSRAKDFVDIYDLVEKGVDTRSDHFGELLVASFAAKKVPLELLLAVGNDRDLHAQTFSEVQQTVSPGTQLLNFDEYFDFVFEMCGRLETRWNK